MIVLICQGDFSTGNLLYKPIHFTLRPAEVTRYILQNLEISFHPTKKGLKVFPEVIVFDGNLPNGFGWIEYLFRSLSVGLHPSSAMKQYQNITQPLTRPRKLRRNGAAGRRCVMAHSSRGACTGWTSRVEGMKGAYVWMELAIYPAT